MEREHQRGLSGKGTQKRNRIVSIGRRNMRGSACREESMGERERNVRIGREHKGKALVSGNNSRLRDSPS